jgi:hypothetical protein
MPEHGNKWRRVFYDAFLALGAGSYGAFFAVAGKTFLDRITSGDYANATWTLSWGIVGMVIFIGILYVAQPNDD